MYIVHQLFKGKKSVDFVWFPMVEYVFAGGYDQETGANARRTVLIFRSAWCTEAGATDSHWHFMVRKKISSTAAWENEVFVPAIIFDLEPQWTCFRSSAIKTSKASQFQHYQWMRRSQNMWLKAPNRDWAKIFWHPIQGRVRVGDPDSGEGQMTFIICTA